MRGFAKAAIALLLAFAGLGIVFSFVPWIGFEIHGKCFGMGRAYCLNAFGHQPDITWELRIDKTSIPLLRIPKHCNCSLCRLHSHRVE